jgi:mRNA-degrading endonuclease RelE of RelBE toxin-antitoxin system
LWNIDGERNQFKRDYKHLSSDLQKKTDDAIMELASSQDPRKKGSHKKGPPLYCLHTYELGNKYRLLYDTKIEQNLLVFLRVGTHEIY